MMIRSLTTIWVPLYKTWAVDRSNVEQIYSWTNYWMVIAIYQNVRPAFALILDRIPYMTLIEIAFISTLQLNGVSEKFITTTSHSFPVVWMRSAYKEVAQPIVEYVTTHRHDPGHLLRELLSASKRANFVARRILGTERVQQMMHTLDEIMTPVRENARSMAKFILESWKESEKTL